MKKLLAVLLVVLLALSMTGCNNNDNDDQNGNGNGYDNGYENGNGDENGLDNNNDNHEEIIVCAQNDLNDDSTQALHVVNGEVVRVVINAQSHAEIPFEDYEVEAMEELKEFLTAVFGEVQGIDFNMTVTNQAIDLTIDIDVTVAPVELLVELGFFPPAASWDFTDVETIKANFEDMGYTCLARSPR
jgi:uncharacterized lipoprotein YehR (DUF1307 family)